MSDPINESFSALLDDQASSMDVQRLLNAMEKQPNKVQQWQELAQCQAQLQKDVCIDVLSDIHDELYAPTASASADLDSTIVDSSPLNASESALHHVNGALPSIEPAFNLRKTLSSIGVAATVCSVSLLGFYQWQQPTLSANIQADIVASSATGSVSSAQIQQRFQQLMQQRSQQASFSLPASENQWQSIEQPK